MMTDGFFARVDDHGWSMAPRIPGRMYPRLPIVGSLDVEFSADEPVAFAMPKGALAVRVGFFDPRGRLLWSSGFLMCAPGDSITVAPVRVATC